MRTVIFRSEWMKYYAAPQSGVPGATAGRSRMKFSLRMRKPIRVNLLVLLLFQLSFSIAHADDAIVLPRGVSRVSIASIFYLPFDKRYGPDGKVEDIATDFNTSLNSRIFPALAPLSPLVAGMASLGDTNVSFEYDITIMYFDIGYGITDRLTAGVRIPYWWLTNTVNGRLNSGPGSSANVGLNPFFGRPGQPPLIPLARGGVPLTTEDVQQFIGPGLPGIPGFGFKRFDSFSDHGLGDMEAGFRYQYLRTDAWLLAFTGGARFPTGRVDDPDNLTDYGFGSGAYALLFRLNNDYAISSLWKGTHDSTAEETLGGRAPGTVPGTVVLNGTIRYDLVLPDKQVKRVPDRVNNPLTANKENVSRDLGDIIELEASAKYNFLTGFTFSSLYKYGFKLQDHASGNKGFAYSSLEDETDYTEQIFIVGLAYSTFPLYLQKKFPLPLTTSLSYRNRFAGSNNVSKSEYIGLGLEVLF